MTEEVVIPQFYRARYKYIPMEVNPYQGFVMISIYPFYPILMGLFVLGGQFPNI